MYIENIEIYDYDYYLTHFAYLSTDLKINMEYWQKCHKISKT